MGKSIANCQHQKSTNAGNFAFSIAFLVVLIFNFNFIYMRFFVVAVLFLFFVVFLSWFALLSVAVAVAFSRFCFFFGLCFYFFFSLFCCYVYRLFLFCFFAFRPLFTLALAGAESNRIWISLGDVTMHTTETGEWERRDGERNDLSTICSLNGGVVVARSFSSPCPGPAFNTFCWATTNNTLTTTITKTLMAVWR